VALTQVHVVSEALVKVKRELHAQLVAAMFPESVGESKRMMTA
jgi:hypothetical protein